MKHSKKLLQLLILLTFIPFINGCMTKQADGKYHTKYSYHPYYDLYASKMSKNKKSFNTSRSITIKNKNYSKNMTKKVSYNDEEKYPSNVPAK